MSIFLSLIASCFVIYQIKEDQNIARKNLNCPICSILYVFCSIQRGRRPKNLAKTNQTRVKLPVSSPVVNGGGFHKGSYANEGFHMLTMWSDGIKKWARKKNLFKNSMAEILAA